MRAHPSASLSHWMYAAPLLSDMRSSSARTTSCESGCSVFHSPACVKATSIDAGTTCSARPHTHAALSRRCVQRWASPSGAIFRESAGFPMCFSLLARERLRTVLCDAVSCQPRQLDSLTRSDTRRRSHHISARRTLRLKPRGRPCAPTVVPCASRADRRSRV